MAIQKPEDADDYEWDEFIELCKTEGVETEGEVNFEGDIEAWWTFWKSGGHFGNQVL